MKAFVAMDETESIIILALISHLLQALPLAVISYDDLLSADNAICSMQQWSKKSNALHCAAALWKLEHARQT